MADGLHETHGEGSKDGKGTNFPSANFPEGFAEYELAKNFTNYASTAA